jgi:hypothetical protein
MVQISRENIYKKSHRWKKNDGKIENKARGCVLGHENPQSISPGIKMVWKRKVKYCVQALFFKAGVLRDHHSWLGLLRNGRVECRRK